MRRTITILATIFAVPMWAAAPAAAQTECFEPDEAGPLLESRNFFVEPTVIGLEPSDVNDVRTDRIEVPTPDSSQIGLKVSQVADDRQHHLFDPNQPNYVLGATLTVDGGAIERSMEPVDGRFGSIVEPIYTVLEPLELGAGTHEITITATDSCGNTGTFTRRIMHVPPALTFTCEGYAAALCDA